MCAVMMLCHRLAERRTCISIFSSVFTSYNSVLGGVFSVCPSRSALCFYPRLQQVVGRSVGWPADRPSVDAIAFGVDEALCCCWVCFAIAERAQMNIQTMRCHININRSHIISDRPQQTASLRCVMSFQLNRFACWMGLCDLICSHMCAGS